MSYRSFGGIVTDMYPSGNTAVHSYPTSRVDSGPDSTASSDGSFSTSSPAVDIVSNGSSATASSGMDTLSNGSSATAKKRTSASVEGSNFANAGSSYESASQGSDVTSATIIAARNRSSSEGKETMNSLSVPSAAQISQMFSGRQWHSEPSATTGITTTAVAPKTTVPSGSLFNYRPVPSSPPVDTAPPVIAPPPSPPDVEVPWYEEYKVPLIGGGLLLLLAAGYAAYKAQ